MISDLIGRPENQCNILQTLTSGQLTKHQMRTMDVAMEVLRVKVSFLLLDGVFKDPSGEVYHDLREEIFAFVHDMRLLMVTNLTKRSLQIVKYQRAIKIIVVNNSQGH